MTSDSEFERHLAISTWRLHHHYQAPYPSPSLQQLMFKMFFIERYPPSTPHGDGNGARATTTSTNSSDTNVDGGSRRDRYVFIFFRETTRAGARDACVSRGTCFFRLFLTILIFLQCRLNIILIKHGH